MIRISVRKVLQGCPCAHVCNFLFATQNNVNGAVGGYRTEAAACRDTRLFQSRIFKRKRTLIEIMSPRPKLLRDLENKTYAQIAILICLHVIF